ncbi:MAG: hypothetical protein ACLTI0_10310 [Phocaeicola dorei]|uniref:hypothetical protein n=1 Tax=Phocaeicola vulgatus TaxID=821 RepID=UPI0034A2064A
MQGGSSHCALQLPDSLNFAQEKQRPWNSPCTSLPGEDMLRWLSKYNLPREASITVLGKAFKV